MNARNANIPHILPEKLGRPADFGAKFLMFRIGSLLRFPVATVVILNSIINNIPVRLKQLLISWVIKEFNASLLGKSNGIDLVK